MVYVSVRQKLAALKIDFGEFGYSDILSYKNGMILIFRNREISDLGSDGALPGDSGHWQWQGNVQVCLLQVLCGDKTELRFAGGRALEPFPAQRAVLHDG
jgi:hypothetical protein